MDRAWVGGSGGNTEDTEGEWTRRKAQRERTERKNKIMARERGKGLCPQMTLGFSRLSWLEIRDNSGEAAVATLLQSHAHTPLTHMLMSAHTPSFLLDEYLLNKPYAFNKNANYLYTAAQSGWHCFSLRVWCVCESEIEMEKREGKKTENPTHRAVYVIEDFFLNWEDIYECLGDL